MSNVEINHDLSLSGIFEIFHNVKVLGAVELVLSVKCLLNKYEDQS